MPRRVLFRSPLLLNFFRWITVGGGSNLHSAHSNTGPQGLLAVPAFFQ